MKKHHSQRRAKAELKKRRRAKIKRSSPAYQTVYRPALSDIKPPPGFRAVSISQATLEYVKPLLEYVEAGVLKDMSQALDLGMYLWDHGVVPSRAEPRRSKEELISQIERLLKMEKDEAENFFDMMVERKKNLIPEDIQPDIPLTMFVRQESLYRVEAFDRTSLAVNDISFSPTEMDLSLLAMLREMDKDILLSTPYQKWEQRYHKMEELCRERFGSWLAHRDIGAPFRDDFPFDAGIFMNFVYRYQHDDPITLQTVSLPYIEEFFSDHLLRKVYAEPKEYAEYPAALTLFYRFLCEIGYLPGFESMESMLETTEPWFLDILRERYS